MENKHKYEGIYSFLNSKYNILYLICKTFLYDSEVDNYRDDIVKSNGLAYKYWFAENVIDCGISIVDNVGAYIHYVDVFGIVKQLFISESAFKWVTFAKFKKTDYADDNFTYSKLKHLRKNCSVVNDMYIEKQCMPFILSTDMESYLTESKNKALVKQMERELLESKIITKALKRSTTEDNINKDFVNFDIKTKEIISNVRNYEIL